MPSSVLRRSAARLRHDWLSQQLRASPGTPHPGSASLQQGMRHCESWACRCQESSRGSAPLTVQAGRLGSCRRCCGLTLSRPSRASDSQCGLSSYLHMKSAARKRTKQLGPSTAVQHAVYHGLSSAQSCDSCALKPPASLSSQVESK